MVAVTVQAKDEKNASRVVKKLREKAIKTFLDTFILSELQNGALSGYDIIHIVQKRFSYLISSGTVYSLLYNLERNGLISGSWVERKRIYATTEKGKQTAQIIANNKEQIIQAVGEIFLNFRAEAAF